MEEGSGMSGGVLVFCVILAVGALIAVCTGLVLDKAAELTDAKAAQAWAHAAQVNAQANLVDARTAQIGMVATSIVPLLLGVMGLLVFALIAVGVIVFLDGRRQEKMLQAQLLAGQSQLHLGEGLRYGPTSMAGGQPEVLVIHREGDVRHG